MEDVIRKLFEHFSIGSGVNKKNYIQRRGERGGAILVCFFLFSSFSTTLSYPFVSYAMRGEGAGDKQDDNGGVCYLHCTVRFIILHRCSVYM